MTTLGRFASTAAICALLTTGSAIAAAPSRPLRAPLSPPAPLPARASPVTLAAGTITGRPHVEVHNDAETSNNWSGYAVQTTAARRFTDVVGRWVQPKVTCLGTGNSFASFWVGIDGYVSGSVEQLGTDSDCEGGSASYFAWWEMYPAPAVQLSSARFPIKAGDTVTARVSVRSGEFTLTLTSSRGWKFTQLTSAGLSYRQSSAEWVAEAPEIGNSVAKLAPFTRVGFTGCSAATNGGRDSPISSFISKAPHDISMVSVGGLREATPSPLATGGHAFAIVWVRA